MAKFNKGDRVVVALGPFVNVPAIVERIDDKFGWYSITSETFGSQMVPESDIKLDPDFNDIKLPTGIKCECGVTSLGQGKHSTWCPIKDV